MVSFSVCTLFAVLLFCGQIAHMQDIGYTIVQQEQDTVITNITCDQNSGIFEITIFNGYVEEKTFYVSGQTDGVSDALFPNPLQRAILPRNYGVLYLYGPTNTGAGSRTIVGARSFISAWLVDYDTTGAPADIFQTVSTVCGNAVGPCTCGFFRIGCQVSGGCGPENYFFFWFLIMLAETLLFLFLGHMTMSVAPTIWDQDGIMRARTNINDHARNPVDMQVDEYHNKLKYGGTTEDAIREELRSVESQLASRVGERNDVSFRERQLAGLASNSAFDDEPEAEYPADIPLYHPATAAPSLRGW